MTIHAVLIGELKMVFNDHVQEVIDPGLQVTNVVVEEGLVAVVETVFPCCALEIQQLWMQRILRKPRELKFWHFVNVVT